MSKSIDKLINFYAFKLSDCGKVSYDEYISFLNYDYDAFMSDFICFITYERRYEFDKNQLPDNSYIRIMEQLEDDSLELSKKLQIVGNGLCFVMQEPFINVAAIVSKYLSRVMMFMGQERRYFEFIRDLNVRKDLLNINPSFKNYLLAIAYELIYIKDNVDLGLEFIDLYESLHRVDDELVIDSDVLHSIWDFNHVSRISKTIQLYNSFIFDLDAIHKGSIEHIANLVDNHAVNPVDFFRYDENGEFDVNEMFIDGVAFHAVRKHLLAVIFILGEGIDLDKDQCVILDGAISQYGLSSEFINYFVRKSKGEQFLSPELFKIISSLYLVKKAAEDIMRALEFVTDPKVPLCYYTPYNTFRYLLPERNMNTNNVFKPGCVAFPENKDIGDCARILLMNTRYMNDPNEGVIYANMLFKTIENVKEIENKDKYVFIKCFTTRVDDLNMWERYAEKGTGCCVVFKFEDNINCVNYIQDSLYNVCYIEKTENGFNIDHKYNTNLSLNNISVIRKNIRSIEKYLNLYKDNFDYLYTAYQLLGKTRYMFKIAHYSYEQEVRMIEELKPGDSRMILLGEADNPLLGVKSEYPIDICKILLGPRMKDINRILPYLTSQLDLLCIKEGFDNIEVIKSDIDYVG